MLMGQVGRLIDKFLKFIQKLLPGRLLLQQNVVSAFQCFEVRPLDMPCDVPPFIQGHAWVAPAVDDQRRALDLTQ